MLPLLLIPITFAAGVLRVSELSPSPLELCLGKLIVLLALCHLLLGLFSYVRGGNIPHILTQLAGKKAVILEADGLGICLAQSL